MPARSQPRQCLAVLAECAEILGWQGIMVDRVLVYGERITVVVDVDANAHAKRVISGWDPVLDRSTLASWHRIPELWADVPPRVVKLVGVLGHYTSWRRAMAGPGSFRGFCATAFLLDREPTDECLITALWHGVGVLHEAENGAVRLVQQGLDGPAPKARYSATRRYAEELIYRRLLDDDLLPNPGAR